MLVFFLFLFGAAIGSFLNVVSLRYDPEKFLLSKEVLGGRSYCPRCKKTLRWFELVPLLSFIAQGGRCRTCHARIAAQYPIVETLSGLIFVFVPWRLANFSATGGSALGGQFPISNFQYPSLSTFYFLLSTFWILVFLTLLLISWIDARLSIIPDEANIFLGIFGVFATWLMSRRIDLAQGSFLKSFSLMFPLSTKVWVNHIYGALFALIVFGAIIVITRGRGMGLGDLKLAVPLGLLFGWPDITLPVVLSFIVGSIFGVYVMVFKNKKMKSAVPFGPFLALAAAITFFFGYELIKLYFSLIMA